MFTCKTLLAALLFVSTAFARESIIYSVDQDIPMGIKDEVIKKNYYLTIGKGQGANIGTVLEVYRVLSRENPYENGKRHNYKIKIGELEVTHTESEASIARYLKFYQASNSPYVEIDDFMIGDQVNIRVKSN